MQFYASRWKIQPRQITRDWGNVAVSWRLCLRIEGLKRNWGVYKWRLKMFNMRLKLIYVMQTLKKNQTNHEKLRWPFLKTVQLNSMCYSEGWSFSGNLFFFSNKRFIAQFYTSGLWKNCATTIHFYWTLLSEFQVVRASTRTNSDHLIKWNVAYYIYFFPFFFHNCC